MPANKLSRRDNKTIAEVYRLYDVEKWTQARIAKKFKLSPSTVCIWLNEPKRQDKIRHDVETVKQARRARGLKIRRHPLETVQEAMRLRMAGLSYAKIGATLGVTKNLIRLWCNAKARRIHYEDTKRRKLRSMVEKYEHIELTKG